MSKEDRKKKREERKANRKPFNETGLGKFLEGAGSTIGSVVGDVLPDSGVLGVVKNLLDKDTELSPEQREHALALLDAQMVEQQEITKRWEADSKSDSWLSKNIRPLTLAYLIACTSILIVLDSSMEGFKVEEHWVSLLSSLLITAVGGYFALREYGKYVQKKFD